MNVETILTGYRTAMAQAGETIAIRRYTGSGLTRTFADKSVRARVTGYNPEELTTTIQQGDRHLIVMAEDVTSILPITAADKVMLRGKELQIISVDDSTRRVGDQLIALEIQARG